MKHLKTIGLRCICVVIAFASISCGKDTPSEKSFQPSEVIKSESQISEDSEKKWTSLEKGIEHLCEQVISKSTENFSKDSLKVDWKQIKYTDPISYTYECMHSSQDEKKVAIFKLKKIRTEEHWEDLKQHEPLHTSKDTYVLISAEEQN